MDGIQEDANGTLKRRGSGLSLNINNSRSPPARAGGGGSKNASLDRNFHYDFPQFNGYAPPGPYPILVNPPPMPTYHYGIPPSPMPYGYPPSPYFPSPDLKRAGSKARMMMDQGNFPTGYELEHFGQTENALEAGNCEERDMPALAALRRSNLDRIETMSSHLESMKNGGRPYSIRKVEENDGYPGVIIEEMLDSASIHNGMNGHQAVVGREPPKDPDAVSLLAPDQFSASLAPPTAPRGQVRLRHTTQMNTVVNFVPQQEAWVIERMGKFNRILEPGVNVLIPVIDKIKYVQSLKEIAIDIPSQAAITIDNVTLNIDGVLYLRVQDPYKASYGVEDPEFAITQLAQTTMRSEIGKITLDTLFRERDNLNSAIVMAINQASDAWGIQCMRYEIRDIRMPERVQEAMQMQVEAERKKRAAILESEGIKTAEINVAEGKKQSKILQSEAEKQQLINEAQGAAEAVIAAGRARAQSIEMVSKALGESNGSNAAALAVAEKYVTAFQELAKTNNTLILPSNTGDVSAMVAQAMGIYNQLKDKQPPQITASPMDDDNDGAKSEVESNTTTTKRK